MTDWFQGMSLPKCGWGRADVNFVQSIGTSGWERMPQKWKQEMWGRQHRGSALTLSVCVGGSRPESLCENPVKWYRWGQFPKLSLSPGLCSDQIQKACWGQGVFVLSQGKRLHSLMIYLCSGRNFSKDLGYQVGLPANTHQNRSLLCL